MQVVIILPASKGWGKVLFTVCLSVHIMGEYPVSGLGGTPAQVWVGGYPIPGLGR